MASQRARTLRGNGRWSPDTLEDITFRAANALLVIEGFTPLGTPSDIPFLHRKAERLLRNPPRSLLLCPGEDLPQSPSLRARVLALYVRPRDVNWRNLGVLQEKGASGMFAAAMAGYLRWLAPKHMGETERIQARLQELLRVAGCADTHRRIPSMIANLAVGFQRFLEFARDVGAIGEREQQELWERGWRALLELGQAQAVHLAAVGKPGPAR